jgi:hypothetical protein
MFKTLSLGRSPFLKEKGAGLEFILSPVEGLQSFLKRKGFPRNLS